MLPKVAIIYLCHGNLRHLPEVVSAWEKIDYPKDRLTIYLVPNASPDGIIEAIEQDVLPRSGRDLPRLVMYNDGHNHGFAKANNNPTKLALDEGHDYIFLENGDLKLHPKSIETAVEVAEADDSIGSVQSLVLYWQQPDTINTSGGMVHIAGYGFARDNLVKRAATKLQNSENIPYASGAAVLYRTHALREVGLLEEGFQMYHEDLELGLRLLVAGYKNALATESLTYHDYSFSRNPKKFAWTEKYRWVVVLSYLKLPSLILFAPLLLLIELGTWPMALMGRWLPAKFWAYAEFTKPRTWKLVRAMRRRTQRLRKISDRELLSYFVGTIEAQETSNWIVEKVANPIVAWTFRFLRRMVTW